MSLVSEPVKPIKVFFSYAHEDEGFLKSLEKHLSILRKQGLITEWHNRMIGAGKDVAEEIDIHLNTSQIILLLISPDFIASDYCYSVEVKRAMERHEAGEAFVIPVILRRVDWKSASFGKLQALPKDGKPIMKWANRDEAFFDVAKGIREAVEELRILKEQRLDEGHTYYKAEHYEEALTSYEKAIILDPSYTPAYNGKGNALLNLNRNVEALAAYKKAISLDPNYAFAHYNEGILLYNLEHYKEALACFERAIDLDPHFVSNYIYKALVLERLGQLEEAVDTCQKYLQLPYNDKVSDFYITFRDWLTSQRDLETQRLEVKKLEEIYEVSDRIRDKLSDAYRDIDVNQDYPDVQFADINQDHHVLYEDDRAQEQQDLDVNQDYPDGQFANINQDHHVLYEDDRAQEQQDLDVNQEPPDWYDDINQGLYPLYEGHERHEQDGWDENQDYQSGQFARDLKHTLEVRFRRIIDLKDSEAKQRAVRQLNADCLAILDQLNDARHKLEDKDREVRQLQNSCNTILLQLREALQLRYK